MRNWFSWKLGNAPGQRLTLAVELLLAGMCIIAAGGVAMMLAPIAAMAGAEWVIPAWKHFVKYVLVAAGVCVGGAVVILLHDYWRLVRQRGGAMKRMKRMIVLLFALVAVAPLAAQAAGYESRSGGSNTSVYDSISGVPVPGGGNRSTSTSTSSYDNWSRSRPIYNGWERAQMSFGVARDAIATMNFVADGFRQLSGAPQVIAAPPAPVCYPQGCYVWQQSGWQWMPSTQPAPVPTVTVSVGQPMPVSRQCTDGRGFYWLC